MRPGQFRCPSEVAPSDRFSNYFGNFGVGRVEEFSPGLPIGDGAFVIGKSLYPQDIVDGLSNTMHFAESRLATDEAYVLELGQATGTQDDYLAAIDVCHQESTGTPIEWHKSWNTVGLGSTLYNHVLPPNARSCSYGNHFNSFYAAASYHTGGCLGLLMDGSVHFYSESIDISVWRNFGSRHGVTR